MEQIFKLICLNNETEGYIYSDLKIGACYDAKLTSNRSQHFFLVQTWDEECVGGWQYHYRHLFCSLAEWRDKQINSILED